MQDSGGELRVPKRDLVAAVAVELQAGRLQIADRIPDSAALIQELMNSPRPASLKDCGRMDRQVT